MIRLDVVPSVLMAYTLASATTSLNQTQKAVIIATVVLAGSIFKAINDYRRYGKIEYSIPILSAIPISMLTLYLLPKLSQTTLEKISTAIIAAKFI